MTEEGTFSSGLRPGVSVGTLASLSSQVRVDGTSTVAVDIITV